METTVKRCDLWGNRVASVLLAAFCMVALLARAENSYAGQKVKNYKVKVLEVLPHEVSSYTQGLFFYDNQLYESSGQYGQSFFRMVDLGKGTTLRSFSLSRHYFGEGSTVLNGKLFILTWLEKVVLVHDIQTFKQLGVLNNPREGWGLTNNGKDLIMSDGSDKLYTLDPSNFMVRSSVSVTLNGKPVNQLNELEYINGEVWANVYMTDTIVIIDPATGVVKATVDCKNLLPLALKTSKTDVLNGIAYNPVTKQIYLTGKYWPKMYKIMLQ
jgi:glutamine cyclotransferase